MNHHPTERGSKLTGTSADEVWEGIYITDRIAIRVLRSAFSSAATKRLQSTRNYFKAYGVFHEATLVVLRGPFLSVP
jgi:hypothetical protein